MPAHAVAIEGKVGGLPGKHASGSNPVQQDQITIRISRAEFDYLIKPQAIEVLLPLHNYELDFLTIHCGYSTSLAL